ncbi:restriction endonuclease subunit S [Granulicatella seriolae]|uniref:Restriction endonuclease subunit S n=1 Tax=Granulicatella seriolae TaxID=2967226 RepID=A0ABT1WNX5_9LACT|nr:restriction endonuclease subunit S [Granulicatella seriolae]
MRYEKYYDVDLPWIKEVPEHWRISKINANFEERREKVSDKDYEPLSVTKNGVFKQLDNVAKTDDGDNRKKVVINDFVINGRSDRKGSSGLSEFEGSVSLINIVLKINKNHPKYMHYLLKSVPFQEEFYRNGKGIVADLWSTNFQSMKSITLPIPSFKEQVQIANFLEWKINEIDRLILIEKEKIKQLNQTMQMYIDSRYKILNLDDKSCDGTKIKYLANQITRRDNECRRYIALENVISQKGVMNISFDELEFNNDGISAEKNMVIFGKLRPYLAKSIIVEDKAICSSEFLVLDPIKVTPEYLKYLMLSSKFIDLVNSSTYGTKMPRANSEFILNLKVIVPDLAEQRNVVEIILESEDRINKAIETILSKIKSMEDLKQTLISEVVTGRIDIRNIDIPEYEKVESVFEEDEDQVEGGEDEWD